MSWLPVAVTVEPTAEPVSMEEARAQCHADGNDLDVELAIYVRAAREHVERYTGLSLVTQTAILRCSSFRDLVRLPTAPIAEVTEIRYLDARGAEQLLDAEIYETVLIGLEPEVRPKMGRSWPGTRGVSDAVRVTAVCGYGAAAAVPLPIKQAMLLIIEEWMRNRASTEEMPGAAAALLSNYRLN
jgi:uncharacterized phiE125 gp8 family phage protein